MFICQLNALLQCHYFNGAKHFQWTQRNAVEQEAKEQSNWHGINYFTKFSAEIYFNCKVCKWEKIGPLNWLHFICYDFNGKSYMLYIYFLKTQFQTKLPDIFFTGLFSLFFKYIGLSKDTFFWSHLMLVDYTLRNLGQQCLKLNIFKCKSLISKPLCHMQWCIFYYPEYSKSYV